jgi:hypothetical protein
MSLLSVVNMSPAERAERRENDEACFHAVEAYCADGIARSTSITKAASSLRIPRNDVIAGYWRHVRREQSR